MSQVVGVQFDIAWEDKQANFERVDSLLPSAGAEPGGLVVLPEMFSTGFSMNVEAMHEGAERPAERFASQTAKRLGAHVVAGVVSRVASGRGRNEALVFDPRGEEIARYCKLHPFGYGGETEHYEAGDEVVSFQWGEFRVTPFVCYDLRFPEVFRRAAKRGTDLFTVIANWPEGRQAHWTALLKARAIENQAYVVGVNRCGADPHLGYSGRSIIIGPGGDVLAEASGEPCALTAKLDLQALRDYRGKFPFLEDIREDFVEGP